MGIRVHFMIDMPQMLSKEQNCFAEFRMEYAKQIKSIFRADMCEAKNPAQLFQCASIASARQKAVIPSP